MLNRRIAQERARRLKEEEEEAERERQRIAQMEAEEAKAFRAQISEKEATSAAQGLSAVQVMQGKDRLRARLAAWQR